MDVILVPGLWAGAASWDPVRAVLVAAGVRPHALTLRGLDSRTADRSGVIIADHVVEITAAVERCTGPVVLVGHAEACGLVHAVVNRRPELIAHAVHVGGFPSADGVGVLSGFPGNGHRSTPPLGDSDPALAALHARFTQNVSPSLDAVQRLTDERRFHVPATLVATEFTAADVRRWMAVDVHPVRELTRMSRLEVVDFEAGAWPQLERPNDLGALIAGVCRRSAEPGSAEPDSEAGRPA
jgi:pimeloyl-ACP methyl ester carboxylesterase